MRRTGNVAIGTDLQDYYIFAGGNDISISVSGLTSDVDVQVLDQFGRLLAQSTNTVTSRSDQHQCVHPFRQHFCEDLCLCWFLELRFRSSQQPNAENADDLLSTATALPVPLTSLTRTGSVGGTGSTVIRKTTINSN